MSERIETLGNAIDRIAEVMLGMGCGDFDLRVRYQRSEGSITIEAHRSAVVKRPQGADVKVGVRRCWELRTLLEGNFARSAVYHDIRCMSEEFAQALIAAEGE